MPTHTTDIRKLKLPAALQSLEWRPVRPAVELNDGDRLLVAVPVFDRSDRPEGSWHYELNVITISCDETHLSIECNGESWGWTLDDADFYVTING